MKDNLAEFEQFGKTALAAVLLVPGLAWILKSKSNGAAVARSLVVVAVVAGALVVEQAMDRTANSLTDGKAAL